MRVLLLLPIVLSACSQEAKEPAVVPVSAIAGLYERSGTAGTPDRVCISGSGADLRFGLVTRGEGASSCTAKGSVRRAGASLALRIDGAPACALSATTTSAGLTLGAATGAECSYYCGAGATLTPGAFVKSGAGPVDIRKTVDVAGEPLC